MWPAQETCSEQSKKTIPGREQKQLHEVQQAWWELDVFRRVEKA